MSIVKTRAIVSSLMFLDAIFLGLTGLGLHVAPYGRVAHETGWTFLGMDKHLLEAVHTKAGVIFLLLLLVHIFVNYKMWLGEIKQFFRK